MHSFKRSAALAIAAIVAIAGCAGEDGKDGPAGVNTGSITGKLTVSTGGNVAGATVTTDPLGLTATSAADGTFTISSAPIGLYTLTVTGAGVTTTTFTGVNVVAGNTTNIGTKVIAYSPMTISLGAVPAVSGPAADVAISATVTGAPAAVTYAWTQVSGPTTGVFSATDAASATFTTGALQDVLASPSVKFLARHERAGVLGVTSQQQVDSSYKLRLTVTSGGFTQTKDLTVTTLDWIQGSTNVGLNTMVIANDATDVAGTYSWSITSAPATSTATLNDATTRNPWFKPDVAGTYVLTNATSGATVTVTAASFVGATPTCGLCHSSSVDKVAAIWAEYQTSAHANFFFNDPTQAPMGLFAAGIDGLVASYYSASCIKCHTTGYNTAAANGGFDESGFVFPATKQAGNFAALTADQQKMGVIGCESCHGPLGSHNNASNAPKAFFNADACGMCHDALTHHDRFALWSQAGHANLELAIDESTYPLHSGNESCGRCHSAQGYLDYVAQQQSAGAICSSYQNKAGVAIPSTTLDSNGLPLWAGNLLIKTPDVANPGQFICRVASTGSSETDLTIRDLGVAYMDGLGMTAGKVESQTCQACHDPHTTTLRVGQDTGTLAAGFGVAGAGAGALCMTCHNGRNGARGDSVTIASIGTPHAPTQTEVLMGQNAYWVNGYVGAHAAVENTCAGCHVEQIPAGITAAGTNHTFAADETICASCHAAGVGVAALVGQWTTARAATSSAMLAAFKVAAGATFNLVGSARTITVNSADVTSASIGRTGLSLKFSVAVENPAAATGTVAAGTSITLPLASVVTNGGGSTQIVTANGRFAKASWNMGLVASQSSVVHNKTFTFQVLSTTAAKVGDATAGAF